MLIGLSKSHDPKCWSCYGNIYMCCCTSFADSAESVSIMGLMWNHYCSTLALPTTPGSLLSAYHSTLEQLPWSSFFPDLAAMDSMMKLKNYPPSCFVFLGRVFPLLDWKTVGAAYRLVVYVNV